MFQVDLGDPETFWLNVTNIALGIATLVCFAVVGWGIVSEVAERLRKRAGSLLAADDHAFLTPGLGLTMADGGKKLDEEPKQ